MSEQPTIDTEKLDKLISEAKASGGSELANYGIFIERLCNALDLPAPDFASEDNPFNDYVLERTVTFKHPDGTTSTGRIDCYKRDCFVLEAKQSVKRGAKRLSPDQMELLPEDARQRKAGHATQGTKQWDKVMLSARKQAEQYARALPVEHGYPPFLLVCDVGNVIEVYADFSGQGKNYAHFPDRRSFRIAMDDLRCDEIQTRLRAIWTDPHSLDPAKRSAEVTRDIAERLARIAKRLEGKHDPKDVAEFLMRCLFTMFAEDVELLPKHSFEELLEGLKDNPSAFVPALENLWKVMDEGGYEPHMMTLLKRFNGALFKSRKALPLDAEGIHELRVAASRDWSDVEPAIFGTLLERALDPRERSKLGAHYTPRAYVERLVVPTIIEPMREEWETVQSAVQEKLAAGKFKDARRLIDEFHHRLCTIRVLDPACGTGNFLYVSLELLKKLEGETLEALENIEGDVGLSFQGETVNPSQFYGLEINPRAVPIADLVLWIGFIKWQLKTSGLGAISEPILHAYGTIREQDAILAYDSKELRRDGEGRPLSRWDGVTKKLHPVTGEEIPDPDATVELYDYTNPKPADWPEAEFIVGNPPFIGGKDMRAELDDGYAEACWRVRPHMPGGADFVMHFWDEAARRLTRRSIPIPGSGTLGGSALNEHTVGGERSAPNPLRRFGFITTNSITQTFSRRIIEKHLSAKEPVSLVFAVPDHPWMKATDKAAVRIAMTAAEKGEHEGVLAETVREDGLNTDTPRVDLEKREGKITAKLTIGADLAKLGDLTSNAGLAHMGVKLHGGGFIVDTATKARFQDATVIHPFVNGRDLAQKRRGASVIDLYGFTADEAQNRFPDIFQHVLVNVKPERDENRRDYYRDNWWIWGEPRKEWRDAISGLDHFIVTTRTSKHRIFQTLPSSEIIESKVVGVALCSSEALAVMSSRLHCWFAESTGGWLGVGNDPTYNHTDCYNPFPLPACVTDDSDPALKQKLADLGGRFDAFRKERLAKHDFLTMTAMYNVLERVRELEWAGGESPPSVAASGDISPARGESGATPLTDAEKDIYDAGLIAVLKEIHDEIDRAVFEAYGWTDLGERLVGRPGATMPSPHKSEDQEAAEEELLTRLVALNLERQAEERRGLVRWLRPDYQIEKLGHKVAKPSGEEQIEADIAITAAVADKPKWPKEPFEQIRIVKDVLAKAAAPASPAEVSATFDGRNTSKRKDRVDEVLRLLAETGGARSGEMGGETRYFMAR